MKIFNKKHILILTTFALLLLLSACGSGSDSETSIIRPGSDSETLSLTLAWNPSSDDSIAGYKVYYNSGEATFPVGVIGVNEGASPIDVGNNTTATLSGLLDNEIHFFTVTAYDHMGNESSFSNIVSTF